MYVCPQGARTEQTVVAEPCMVRAIWDAFREDKKHSNWRRVLTAIAVCASVKPLRFAHAVRSRPVARTKWWAAFWAYQGKARTDGVLRGGFRWFVPLVTPTLRQAVDVLWASWNQIWAAECRTRAAASGRAGPGRVARRQAISGTSLRRLGYPHRHS